MRMLTKPTRKRENGRAATATWPLTPAKAPVRPALPTGIVVGAAIAVLLAALCGWALRSLTTSEPPPAPPAPKTATAGPVTIAVNGDWTPARAVPGVPGLDAGATAAFVPASGLRAYAFATVAPIRDGSLLPEALRALLPRELPKPKPTTLLGLPALHYPEQAIAGERRMEVTVVPTSAGSLAVTCVAPRESWVAALGCAAGVRRLELRDAAWLAPREDLAVRARIPGVVSKLDARRVTLRKKLAAAKTRRGQARFARRLARAYAAAAATLAPVAPAKGAPAKLVTALKSASASQAKLSIAAAKGHPKRYKRAKRAIKRDDAAVKRALAAID
jgi:hypothetical protein